MTSEKKPKAINIYMTSDNNTLHCAGIYKIIATTGHFYIGSSKNVYSRFQEHLRELRNSRHANIHMQRRFNKYPIGWACEVIEIINNPIENLLVAEQRHINYSYNNVLCMNINPDATKPPSHKGRKQSTESIAKRVLKCTGQKRHPLTPEHRFKPV